jgi:hypothetical protein
LDVLPVPVEWNGIGRLQSPIKGTVDPTTGLVRGQQSLLNMLIIEEITWLKENCLYDRLYTAGTYLSVGTLTVFHVFYPVSRRLMRSEGCSPEDADTVIIKFRHSKSAPSEYHISDVGHFKSATESVASFEIDGQRYCCCSSENWKEFIVPDVPPGFERHAMVVPQYGGADREQERELLKAIYGKNRMHIPIPDIYEICIKHAFHPILLFGYFSCALWGYQGYYWYTGLLMFGILVALHFMTQVSVRVVLSHTVSAIIFGLFAVGDY